MAIAVLVALATTALAAGGLKLAPTTIHHPHGDMTHGPGSPFVAATVTAGTPDTLIVEGVAGTFAWDGDRYVNENGFWYRFDEFFHWEHGDKWTGTFGGPGGVLSTCAFRYGVAD